MKHLFAVLVAATCVTAQTLADDQAAVQAILDANDASVTTTVVKVEGDRVVELLLFGSGPRKNIDKPLTVIPGDIGNLDALTTLEIGLNDIATLPPAIGNLTSLTTLKILWNRSLVSLPDEIGNLTELTHLDLQNNALTALPSTIGALAQVTLLRVEGNGLTALPDGIGQMSALEDLFVFSNALTTLPSSLMDLENLRTLSLGNNRLCDIEDEDLLEWLNARSTTWASGQYCAPDEDVAAVEAILAANEVTGLAVQSVTTTRDGRIAELRLSNRGLTTLPGEHLGVLTGLRTLSLASNHLEELPDEMALLTELTTVALKGNNLTTLPDGVLDLPNLERFGVDSNMLCALPDEWNLRLDELDDATGRTWREEQVCEIAPADFNAVAALLAACGAGAFSPNVVARTTLDRVSGLELAERGLTRLEIPEDVAALTELRNLWLMDNDIKEIPPEINRLTMVTMIAFDRNPLEHPLPVELAELTQLTSLGLQNLGLSDLAPEMVNLVNLESISLNGNPLCDISEELAAWLDGIDSTWVSKVDCSGSIRFVSALRPGSTALHVAAGRQGELVTLVLPRGQQVRLDVYTLSGARVQSLLNGSFTAGVHRVGWDSRSLAAGTYHMRLKAGGEIVGRTFVIER